MLEWLFTCPALGISVLSWSLLRPPVGLFAAVSDALPVDDEDDDEGVDDDDDEDGEVAVDVDVSDELVLDDDVVPVGALEVASLGCPAPVGVLGVAGSGGAADGLVDGVTGGVALVLVVVSVRLQADSVAAETASAMARAVVFMESPLRRGNAYRAAGRRAWVEPYASGAMQPIGTVRNPL